MLQEKDPEDIFDVTTILIFIIIPFIIHQLVTLHIASGDYNQVHIFGTLVLPFFIIFYTSTTF